MDELLAESGFDSVEAYLEALESGVILPEQQQAIAALIDEANNDGSEGIAVLLAALFIIGGVNAIPRAQRGTGVYYSALTQQFIVQGRAQNDRTMRRRVAREQLETAEKTRRIAADYLNRSISLGQFRRRMGITLVRAHLRLMQAGAGGRRRVTGQHLRALHSRMMGQGDGLAMGELRALHRFVGQMRGGGLSDAQILARAYQYGLNIRPSYEESRGLALAGSGYVAKRFLDPTARHCPQCPDYATDEWTPADQVVNVGVACACRGRCKCIKIYARVQDVAGFNVANFADALRG